MNFFGTVTKVGGVIGALVLFIGMMTSKGAPQEAAVAGIALAFAVIPYVLFRVKQIGDDAMESKIRYGALLKRLDTLADGQAGNPETHVKCPDCRELVLSDARKCKHCGCALVPQ